jgi:hypothetical protein
MGEDEVAGTDDDIVATWHPDWGENFHRFERVAPLPKDR